MIGIREGRKTTNDNDDDKKQLGTRVIAKTEKNRAEQWGNTKRVVSI